MTCTICFSINSLFVDSNLNIIECSMDYNIFNIDNIENPNSKDSFKINCNTIDIAIDTTESFIDKDILNDSEIVVYDLCVGEEFSINLINNNPSQELQHRWYASSDFISEGESTSNPTFSPAREGIFGVLLVTTDQAGCRRRDQLDFSVHAITDVEILVTEKDQNGNDINVEAPESIYLNCNSNSDFTLSSIGTSSTGEVLIEWRNGDNELIGETPEVKIEPLANETFSVTLTDLFGCNATKSIQFIGQASNYVLRNPLSNNEIQNLDNDEALESCLAFSNPHFGIDINTTDQLTFLWSGDIVQANQSEKNPILAPPYPGTYNIHLLITNQFGCSYEYDFDLFFYDDEVEEVINYTQECGTMNIILEAPYTDFNFYTWNIIEGNTIASNSEQSTVIEYNEPGQYEVRLVPKENSKCNLPELSQMIEVHSPLENINIEANYLECKEDTLIIQFLDINSLRQESLNYEWQFSNGLTSFAESPIVHFTQEGIYQVDLKAANRFGCEVNETIMVEVELLNLDLIQDSISICSGEGDVELNPNGEIDLNYQWLANDYFNDLSQNNPIVSPLESTTFEVNVSQAFQEYTCQDTKQVTIIVAPKINNIIDVQDIDESNIEYHEENADIFLCSSNLTPFTLLAPLYENASYYWYSSSTLSTESLLGQEQILEVDLRSNSFDEIYLEIEVAGCKSDAYRLYLNYESDPELDINAVFTPSTGCGPGTLQLIANEESNSSPIISYVWEGPNGFSSNVASPSFFVNGPENNGDYALSVFTKGGCNGIISLNVNEITPSLLPNPSIELEGTPCEGEEFVLALNQEYPDEALYFWSVPSEVNVLGLNSKELAISAFDRDQHFGRYTLQVMVDTCISSIDTFLLEPSANITVPNSELCEGSNFQLNLFSSVGTSFQWSGPNNFSSIEKSPWLNNVSVLNNGIYTVEITDTEGCMSFLDINVDNILPNPSSGNIAVEGPICEGEDIVLTSDASGIMFEWISPLGLNNDGQNLDELVTSEPSTIISNTSPAYLPGDWKVIVADNNGCTAISNAVSVGITEQSVATILGDASACEGESLKVFAATVEEASYEWFLEDEDGNLVSVSNAQAYEISDIDAGLYSISLAVSVNTCPSELTTKSFLIANRPTASPDYTIVPSADCNAYDALLLSNVNSTDVTTINWSGPNGFTSSETNPVINNVSSDDLGVYTVQVMDDSSCSSIMYAIELSEIPEPINRPVIIQSRSACKGSALELIATEYIDSTAIYTWYGPDGILSTNSNNTISISNFEENNAGIYSVSVALNNCILSSQDFAVTIQDLPEITINTPSTFICSGDILNIESNAINVSTFQWTGPNGFASTDQTVQISNVDASYNGIYTLVATSSTGCSITEDIDINFIQESFESPAIFSSNICRGEPLVLSTNFTGISYRWISPLGNSANLPELNSLITTDNSLQLENDNFYYLEGFWRVIVTNAEGCEYVSDFELVSFQENNTANLLLADITCKGDDIILSTDAEGENYEWTFEPDNPNMAPIILNTDNNFVIVLSEDEAYLEGAWSLNVSSNFGCFTPSDTAIVQFSEVPTPSSSNTGPYCSGQSAIQLLAQDIPFGEYSWYQGDPNENGILVSNEQSPSININPNADTIPFFLVISQDGCSSKPSITEVVFSAELTTNITTEAVLNEDCSVSELQLFSNASGTGPLIYSWTGPNNFTSSEANPIVTIDGSVDLNGIYTLQIIDNNDCIVDSNILVELEQGIASPAISVDQTQVCVGDALTISSSAFAGSEATYIWTGPLGSSENGSYSNLETLVFSEVSVEDEGFYSLSVLVDGCLSDASNSILITVGDAPEVELPNSINVCFDTTTIISLPLTIINGDGNVNFEWSGPNQFHSQDQNPVLMNITAQNAGLYSVIAFDSLGCSSDTFQLNLGVEEIPQTPSISAVSSQVLCEGEQFTVAIDNFNSSLEYTWSFENGITFLLADSLLTIDSVQIAEHMGMLSVSSTNGNCTSNSSELINIVVNPVPEIVDISNSTENSPACFGETVQLIAPDIPGAIYQWTGPNNFTSNTKNVLLENATHLDAGTYSLVVEVNGCISAPSQTAVIIEGKIDQPMLSTIDIVCEGSDVLLEVLNPDTTLIYEWFNSYENQSVNTGSFFELTDINLEAEGTYYVVASSQNCSSDASQIITIEIESLEESSAYAGQDTIVCQSDFLLGQDTSQELSGTWSILGNNTTSSILNPNEYTSLVVDLVEGENKLSWTVDAAICFEHIVDTISITYLPPPFLLDDVYDLAMNGESINNIVLNDQLATSEFLIGLLSSAKMGTFELLEDGQSTYIPQQNFIGMDTIQYSVCYEFCPTDCDEASVIFRVGEESECFIPSIFTPNGDGVNDYFAIPFLRKYEQSKIYIYNRWGDEVYFSDNYQGEWDGTYRGGSLPSGTYYYILEINDQQQNIKIGYVFIQR